MLSRKLIHRTLASAFVSTALVVVAVQQPAAAAGVTLNASVDCTNNDYWGDTRDWYPSSVQVYTRPSNTTQVVPTGSLVANPGNHAWLFSIALPAGDTSVQVQAKCSGGHQWGDFYGNTGSGTVNYPGGISAVNASWSCSTSSVYPGPWLTWCVVSSYSFS